MRSLFLSVPIFLMVTTLFGQDGIVFERRFVITANSLLHGPDSDKKQYDMKDKQDLDSFLRTAILNDVDFLNSLKPKEKEALDSFLSSPLTNSACLVIRHNLDPTDINSKPFPVFTEEDDIVKTVIHKEGTKFSDYMLGTKKILLVFIGGEKDLQKAVVKIKNNPKALAVSFDGLKALIGSALKAGEVSKLPCRVVLLNEGTIDPPSDITVDVSKDNQLKFTIHEKAWAQFKAGVAWNRLDKKYFKIQGNQLNVTLDSAGKATWKTNLIAIFDFYPWGRDIDRLDVLWKGGIPLVQRIGIYGGLQISKDPLQGYYYGLSFAPAKNMTVNFGGATVLDEGQQTVNIGSFTSLNDAKQLLGRRYVTKFFLGISFSPSDVKNIIFGESKDEKK